MLFKKIFLAALTLISCFSCSWSYEVAAESSGYQSDSEHENSAPAPIAVATKIDSANLPALHQYGYSIGKPLLVKNYGALTHLYSALAPKRSFLGAVDPGFYKDAYGNIKYIDGAAIAVIAM